MLGGFFSNLIFAIIARILCGNHLKPQGMVDCFYFTTRGFTNCSSDEKFSKQQTQKMLRYDKYNILFNSYTIMLTETARVPGCTPSTHVAWRKEHGAGRGSERLVRTGVQFSRDYTTQ